MRFKLRTLFMLVLFAAVATPIALRLYWYYNPPPFFAGPTVGLCGTGGLDCITHEHIANLLSLNGINSITEGSAIYGTEVERSRLSEAIKLLESSAANGIPSIIVKRDARNFIWVEGDETHRFDLEFNTHIDNIDQRTKNEHEQIILAIRKNATDSYLATRRLPVVKRLTGSKRKYLDRSGRFQDAYDVELELTDDVKSPTCSFTEGYQVMENFLRVSSTGGHGSGLLPDQP